MRRNDKLKNIEKINKRMVSESLPTTINFTEHEVFNMVYEAFDGNIPDRLKEELQKGLKAKGRYFGPDKTPEGAYN